MRDEIMREELKEECGVFGIVSREGRASRTTYYGLFALQHRGQESAGIAVSEDGDIHLHKAMGLVGEVFDDAKLEELKGDLAVGHVRYSTSGDSSVINAQPLVFKTRQGTIALCHNGNLANSLALRESLKEKGSIFQTTVDTEVIAALLAGSSDSDPVISIRSVMKELKGAYALIIMTRDRLIGVRDPLGIRPLCIGRKEKDLMLSSESCAFETVGGSLLRDVMPGEIVVIDRSGMKSYPPEEKNEEKLCIFEFIYFGRPDSVMKGQSLYMSRKRAGKILCREVPADADFVCSVPDSGTPSAIGFSEASGIPFLEGLVKNRYVGRTFIKPSQNQREIGVALKLNVLEEVVRGKSIVLVDDSIVRGTTIKKLISRLRDCGAGEIHLRISAPPVMWPCFFGIDTPSRDELLGARFSVEEIGRLVGADSIGYLSLEGLVEATSRSGFCTGCFSGQYPVDIEGADGRYTLDTDQKVRT